MSWFQSLLEQLRVLSGGSNSVSQVHHAVWMGIKYILYLMYWCHFTEEPGILIEIIVFLKKTMHLKCNWYLMEKKNRISKCPYSEENNISEFNYTDHLYFTAYWHQNRRMFEYVDPFSWLWARVMKSHSYPSLSKASWQMYMFKTDGSLYYGKY